MIGNLYPLHKPFWCGKRWISMNFHLGDRTNIWKFVTKCKCVYCSRLKVILPFAIQIQIMWPSTIFTDQGNVNVHICSHAFLVSCFCFYFITVMYAVNIAHFTANEIVIMKRKKTTDIIATFITARSAFAHNTCSAKNIIQIMYFLYLQDMFFK